MRERAKQKKSEKYVTETAVLLLFYPIQYIHYFAHELALEIFRALPLTYIPTRSKKLWLKTREHLGLRYNPCI